MKRDFHFNFIFMSFCAASSRIKLAACSFHEKITVLIDWIFECSHGSRMLQGFFLNLYFHTLLCCLLLELISSMLVSWENNGVKLLNIRAFSWNSHATRFPLWTLFLLRRTSFHVLLASLIYNCAVSSRIKLAACSFHHQKNRIGLS